MTFAPLVAFVTSHGSLSVAAKAAASAATTTATTSVPFTTTAATTSLHALYEGAGNLMDYSQVASSFFSSIRIPAALLAGSSLATMFTDPDADKEGQEQARSPMRNRIMVFYHLAAFVSFLLSVNVIITATVTSTRLLLGMKNPMARSAYELLRRELDLEFISTRWSFFASVVCFLTSVTGRLLVEFQLLERRRFRMAVMLVSGVLSLVCHLLSLANRSIRSWPNMGVMTCDLIGKLCHQALHYPLEAVSVGCALVAVFMGFWAFVKTKGFSRLDFDEISDYDDDDELDEYVEELSSRV